ATSLRCAGRIPRCPTARLPTGPTRSTARPRPRARAGTRPRSGTCAAGRASPRSCILEPMQHPLAGSRAKIERGREHVDALRSELSSGLSPIETESPLHLVPTEDPNVFLMTIVVSKLPDLPL